MNQLFASIKQFIPEISGYFFSVFIAHIFLKLIVVQLWQSVDGKEYTDKRWIRLSASQGFVERILYTISFQLGYPEFIAVWLALKVASQWQKWSKKPGYNAFLVGSGLSITYAIVGALIIPWIRENDIRFLLVPIGLIAANLMMYAWIAIARKYS